MEPEEFHYVKGSQSYPTLYKVLLILFSILVAVLSYVLAVIKCPFDPVYYRLEKAPSFTGPLQYSNILTKAETLFQEDIFSVESLVARGHDIYASLRDGRIIKADFQTRSFKTLRSKNAIQSSRPMGMRLDSWGHLVLVESTKGLYTLDYKRNFEVPLFTVKDRRPHNFYDIDFLSDGSTVFTDSSNRFTSSNIVYELLENRPRGSLWQYNPKTLSASVLLEDLHYPTGVQAHADKESVLIAECSMARIVRYFYSGDRYGTLEIFSNNLPGYPLRIRNSREGNYLVTIATSRNHPIISRLLHLGSSQPWIRIGIGKILPLRLVRYLLTGWPCLVLELDSDGDVLASYHHPSLHDCSQASWESHHDHILVASPRTTGLVRVEL